MSYIITDNNGIYLVTTSTVTSDINHAHKWDKEEKAKNTLLNLSKHIRNKYKFKVQEISDSTKNELETECDISLDEIQVYLDKMLKYYVNDDKVIELKTKISDLDLKINDIQHAIEINPVDDEKGLKYYHLQNSILIERRKYKNELKKILSLQSVFDYKVLQDVIKSLKGLDNQIYHPRKMPELFEKET